MKNIILEKLRSIEKENRIKILFSCESGSRGWLFPSIDSDFDVRFIYMKSIDQYLSVSKQTDHLSFPINDELDIYGWDLKKVLQLLMKSNTTPFEWLQSPVTYMSEGDFRTELWKLCTEFFSQRTNVLHYLGISRAALDTLTLNNEIKIKKLFYILRSLLSAKWCLEKNEIAPMDIISLMPLLPKNLEHTVNKLIEFKANHNEAFVVKLDPGLKSFINEEFINCEKAVSALRKNTFDVNLLDTFFLKMMRKYDYR